jgi:hypothetical protein
MTVALEEYFVYKTLFQQFNFVQRKGGSWKDAHQEQDTVLQWYPTGTVIPQYVLKAYGGNGSIAPVNLNLGTREGER